MISGLLIVAKIFDLYKVKKYKELFNYLIVGGLTTVVSIVTYYIFRLFIENYEICTVLSWIFAVLFAYFTNRKYVFNSNESNILKEFLTFVSSRILSLLLELFTMFILVDLIGVNDKISKIFVQFIIIVVNYVFSKLFVFKK